MSTPTRMQRVAVLCWVLAFFVFFLIAPVLTMLLLFTPFRVIVIVYLLWIYLIDSKTSENGGRSSEIFHNFFLWKYIRDYFPVKSVLAVPLELDPKRNYVVAVFPHGIYTIGAVMEFRSNLGISKQLFRNHKMYSTTLPINFSIPFYREIILASGSVSSSQRSIDYILGKPEGGNVVGIAPGGAAEAQYSNPGGNYELVLKRRKGFVRLALKHGSPIVPVFSFGEIDLVEQVQYNEGSWQFRMQQILKKFTRINFVIPKDGLSGMVPRNVPVTAVYGTPIDIPKLQNPTDEQVNEYHQKVLKQVAELFEEHKYKYLENPGNTKLIFL